MASTYALPASTIHRHGSDHGCSHSHSHTPGHGHSHSHSHSPSLNTVSPSLSRKDGRSVGGHSHNRSQATELNFKQHRANSNVPMPLDLSSKSRLSHGGHWRTDSTPGGKPLMTPTDASFDAAGIYQPPVQTEQHSHSHSHHDHHDHHDHSPERSRFTKALLTLTARWPLIHAVVVERDSRRIFYFMSYVPRFPRCQTVEQPC